MAVRRSTRYPVVMLGNGRRLLGPAGVLGLWVFGLVLLPGCASPGRVVLHQPFAPPAQQNLELAAAQAYYSCTCGEQALAMPFPLPGAQDGPRAFVLYLLAPDGAGTLSVDPASSNGVRGFLIQEVGALAGRSDVQAGSVTVTCDWFSRHRRRIKLDLRCEDGTVIAGQAQLRANPNEIRALETEFAGDVTVVARPDSAAAGERTPPRDSATQ